MSTTIPEVLERTAGQYGERPALRWKNPDGVWRTATWQEYRDRAHRVARGLLALGVEPGQGVAIIGFNRPEWFQADIGAILAGAVPTGVYTTNTAEQYRYVVDHCEAPVAVVEHQDYLSKLLSVRHRLPRLTSVVVMDGDGSGREGVLGWDRLLELGDRVEKTVLEERMAALRPDDLCTLIYTSGTTGDPKAVMLSHRNVTWVAESLARELEVTCEEQLISYLPLSHIAEQVVTLHAPMWVGACTSFAESLEKVPENLREVRPTFFFAVPRVWEKVQARIEAGVSSAPPLRRAIFRWAQRQGLAGGYADQRGRSRPLLYPLAERLVFRKVRDRLGLDRARGCATSAAPIGLDTLDFFQSLGIPILEVYGMSEVTGPTTFSYPDRYRLGCAGVAIPGTDLRTAEDGEILMRGPHVFLGYFKDEVATRETLDEEGWIHSGDIGELDEDGFLRVTDRKKELIITSGGKNVAPQVIEGRLKAISGVSQAVVVGDRRNYLAALLTLDPDQVPGVATAAGSPARTPEEAAECPIFLGELERRVEEEVNSTLARYETIKRIRVVPHELTVEGGELTPTLKLKRRVVDEKYREEIADLYAPPRAPLPSA